MPEADARPVPEPGFSQAGPARGYRRRSAQIALGYVQFDNKFEQPMKRWLLIVSAMLAIGAVIFLAALPALKRQGEVRDCVHQMRAILCVACGMWPEEHGDHLPSDFVSMSPQYITTPAILFCRADHSHQRVWDWALFNEKNCSYEIVSPGLPKSDTSHVFMRCKVHGLVGYADGRLLDASGKSVSW